MPDRVSTDLLRSAGRANRLARRVLLGLIVLAIAANVGLAVAISRQAAEPLLAGAPGQSERVVLAVAAGPERTLVATRDNAVLLVENGETVAQASFDQVVGALAASPDGGRIAVGTADGTVTELSADLTPTGSFQVEGRVVGLAITAGDALYVAHGIGAYGDRYFVSAVPTPGAPVAASVQVRFPITALTALGEDAVYGTGDSRVGRIPAGATSAAWETTLRSPVTRLLGVEERQQILAGGDEGVLSLVGADGMIVWTASAGQYPLRGLAYHPESERFFAGNSRGALMVFGSAGEQLLSQAATDGDLEAIVPTSDPTTFRVVPRQGGWQELHPDALAATRRGEALRGARLVINGVLALAAIAAAVVAVEPWRLYARRQLRLAARARTAYVLLLPAIALIVMFSYYPAGLAFYYSLTSFSLARVTEFVGFDNYREVLFEDRYFRTGITNMIIIVGTSILKTITVPLLVAELVFWLRNSVHQYLFRTLFILPAVVPDLVFTLMWRQVYDPNTGLLNQLLGAVGLASWQRAWLGDDQTAIWAIVGVGFPFVSAFAFLIFMGGLLNINAEYFDAAKVDGARWWQRFFHLDLPLLLPQFRILLFFAIVGSVQGFASVFVLTRGGPGTATYVPALQMYFRIAEGDFGYASAIGVVLFVLILALTLVVLRFRRNEAVEG